MPAAAAARHRRQASCEAVHNANLLCEPGARRGRAGRAGARQVDMGPRAGSTTIAWTASDKACRAFVIPQRGVNARGAVPLNTPALAHGLEHKCTRCVRLSLQRLRTPPLRVYTFTSLIPATASSLSTHHGAPLPSRLHFFVRIRYGASAQSASHTPTSSSSCRAVDRAACAVDALDR